MKPGLASVTFRALPAPEVIRVAAEAGLMSIEWGGDVHVPHGNISEARRVAKLTKEHGLEAAAYGSYYRAGVSEAEGLSFSEVLQTAVALECRRIRVWAGGSNAEDVSAPEWTRVAAEIRRVTALARREDIDVVLEFHAGTLANSYASAFRLLQELEDTGLVWQPASRLNSEENTAGLKRLRPWIRHCHCFHSAAPSYRKTPLSAGAGDWKHYLALLDVLPAVQHVLLEFVSGDEPAQCIDDAATLRGWLKDRGWEKRCQ